jgi:hypothetical protein
MQNPQTEPLNEGRCEHSLSSLSSDNKGDRSLSREERKLAREIKIIDIKLKEVREGSCEN